MCTRSMLSSDVVKSFCLGRSDRGGLGKVGENRGGLGRIGKAWDIMLSTRSGLSGLMRGGGYIVRWTTS